MKTIPTKPKLQRSVENQRSEIQNITKESIPKKKNNRLELDKADRHNY